MRGRQIPLIPAITEAVREGHKRIIVQLPTGAGKTVVAAHLMQRSADKGRRPIFIAPAIALVEQTLASFEFQGIRDIGIIQAQHHRTDWTAQIQIASRDTLVRRALPEVDFVIVDEVHDQRDALNDILASEAWCNKIAIGLSATPWSRGLGLHWTKLIVGATIRDMIEDGPPTGLSPFRVYVPPNEYKPDMTGVRTVAGDFQESGAARVMSDVRLVGDAVDNWLKRRQSGEHPGDRTFLYGVNRAHAKCLMEAFNAAGVPCGYIDGESTPEERERTFERYRSRKDKVLANVGVLITGVDEDVRCIVDCAPTKSEIRHVQKIGRGLRLADGKDSCLILDHADNNRRVGLVTDIHHETLDVRKPGEKGDAYVDEKETPKPKECKKCHAVIPPRSKACPSCGYVLPVVTDIVHEAGELALLGSKSKKAPKPKKDEKQVFYSGLLMMSHQLHFKDGWAANKYKERFGCWPRGLNRIATTPTKAVRDFVSESRKKYLQSVANGNPPTDHQIERCMRLGIKLEAGATRGSVDDMLDAYFKEQRRAK